MFGKPLASTPSPCLSRRCKTEHKPPAIAQRALSAPWPWSVSGCLWCAPVCYFKGIPRWCKPCNFWEITSRTKFLFFFATESMTFCVYCWWETLFQMAAYFLILFFFFFRIYCNGSKSDIISIVFFFFNVFHPIVLKCILFLFLCLMCVCLLDVPSQFLFMGWLLFCSIHRRIQLHCIDS